jgi:hypothetical protein
MTVTDLQIAVVVFVVLKYACNMNTNGTQPYRFTDKFKHSMQF